MIESAEKIASKPSSSSRWRGPGFRTVRRNHLAEIIAIVVFFLMVKDYG